MRPTEAAIGERLRLVQWADERNFTTVPNYHPPIVTWGEKPSLGTLKAAWRRLARAGRPIRVYVNVPYCATRCEFCFVPVSVLSGVEQRRSWLASVKREIALWRDALAGAEYDSLYVGGGSPSLLAAEEIGELFGALGEALRPARGAQIAFDACPSQLDARKASALRAAGVNWMTLGVQSLDEEVCRRQNRPQTRRSVVRAIAWAHSIGCGVNADLICGLDGQTEDVFVRDVAETARLRPEQIHLQIFAPTRWTPFAMKGRTQSEETQSEHGRWRARGAAILEAAGYRQLDEDSYGLRPDCYNRQVSAYHDRERAPLLGLGPGAVSYIPGAWRYVHELDEAKYASAVSAGRAPLRGASRCTPIRERANYLYSLFYLDLPPARLSEAEYRRQFKAPLSGPVLGVVRELERVGRLAREDGAWRVAAGGEEIAQYVKSRLLDRATVATLRREARSVS